MPRDYKKEYKGFHSKPEEIRKRARRNKARADMGLKNGDGREVDHKKPLSKGGGDGKSNLRVTTRKLIGRSITSRRNNAKVTSAYSGMG